MTEFALFKDGKQISKWHSSRLTASVEAFEKGAVIVNHADYSSDKTSVTLAAGYEIRERQE